MLGTAGASKLVNDISSLADIARAIGDASKADRLEAIRDEFKSSLESLQKAEAAIVDKIQEEKETKEVNDLTLSSLQKWNDELDKKETELKAYDVALQQTQVSILEDQKQLKSDRDVFQKSKVDWMSHQNNMITDFNAQRDKTLADYDKREASLKARESAVSLREDKASDKEITLFKQSQLAAAFAQSVK